MEKIIEKTNVNTASLGGDFEPYGDQQTIE
jgi:hypothetical protein